MPDGEDVPKGADVLGWTNLLADRPRPRQPLPGQGWGISMIRSGDDGVIAAIDAEREPDAVFADIVQELSSRSTPQDA